MAFADLQREQYERDEFQAARLAVMCRATIGSLWGGDVPTEFDLLGWEPVETAVADPREAEEDAAFEALLQSIGWTPGAVKEVGH